MIKSLLFALAVVSLAGCASDASSLQYYLLHSPSYEGSAPEPAVRGRLRIDKLTLPDYLKQRGLAMQTGPATVYFSAQHVWAEPLASDVMQTLAGNLWQDQGIQVYSQNIYDKAQTTGINLVIEDFIATHHGYIVLTGHYWMFPPNSEPMNKRFNFRVEQQQDGFEHTVVKMRELIAMLAEELAASSLSVHKEP